MIQDYLLQLTVVMTPRVIQRIVRDNPSCVMFKHEDWPGLEKISSLRSFQSEGTLRPISILTGNGGLFLDFEMERGADGAMTGYAFPDMLVDVVKLSQSGQRDAAHDLFDAHLPLIRYEQQQGNWPRCSEVRPAETRRHSLRFAAGSEFIAYSKRKDRSRLSPKPPRPTRPESQGSASTVALTTEG